MQYKHLFIDFDDTLGDFSANSYHALQGCYASFQLGNYYGSYDEFYRDYKSCNETLWKLFYQEKITKEELLEARFSIPLERRGCVDKGLYKALSDNYFDELAEQHHLMPHAVKLLEYLYPKYPMHILSNGFKEVQHRKIASSGVGKYFQHIVLSDEVGANKPSPTLFNHALQLAGAKPEESVMIGDNYHADIIGAANVGMATIYFNPRLTPLEGFVPTHQVASLEEIESIL